MEEIVAEWECFARNLSPETAKMDSWALRDHAKPMLEAIAKDIRDLANRAAAGAEVEGLGPAFKGEAMAAGMSGMICDLLEFTRSRLGNGIPVTPTEANLESVSKAVINEVSHVRPKTAFRFESAGRLDGLFDRARIHQAVSNLLNNAVHHGRQDSPVFLVVSGDDDALRLQVSNQGVPIAPDLLQTIFEPLVQKPADEAGPRGSTNSGLGLFIAREIVVAHGGTILASSSAEAGTTFTVELPRSVAKHRHLQAAPVPQIAKQRG